MAAEMTEGHGVTAEAVFSVPPLAVVLARQWLGTPYRHQASLCGVGTDCLGLVRGIWRGLHGVEPEAPPPYSQDWCEVGCDEGLWRAAARWLAPGRIDCDGDVLLFRMAPAFPAKHLAIRATASDGAPSIIHAYSGRAVIESPFSSSWRTRVVACFRFPEKVYP
jgi:NlpC/P60 family putative phage cell wall peptidase